MPSRHAGCADPRCRNSDRQWSRYAVAPRRIRPAAADRRDDPTASDPGREIWLLLLPRRPGRWKNVIRMTVMLRRPDRAVEPRGWRGVVMLVRTCRGNATDALFSGAGLSCAWRSGGYRGRAQALWERFPAAIVCPARPESY